MRTTIRMDDALLRRAKEYAARSGTTLTRVIENALREHLARRPHRAVREPVVLPTFGGQGLLPGVDLDDTASLIDTMESGGVAAD
jgi:hypothetical protein